ncbi:hypothetical protein [Deinococcus sp. Leaf326]|uniref:hypothetical protein n=1 Tax=Deinococcus sp. Leaf326 TaxID=1736338 RepID=UPI0006F3CD6E|nr:hypothetical protein [Deinococcus sp. Leaf326]KQR22912.1 hypothetical protein ASF71_07020 [Deinococcus sp. Leaf326]
MKQRLPYLLLGLLVACYLGAIALFALFDPTPARQVALVVLCGVAFVSFGALGALMEDPK